MTEILQNNLAVFKFTNEFNPVENEYCEITVNVKKIKYQNGELYYDIDYKYKYSHKNNQNCKQSNPLVAINESENNGEEMYNGDIIHVNSLTDQMINYLLMSYSELEKYSGHNTPQQYKTQIIKAINLFWD